LPFFFEPNFDALVKPLEAVARLRKREGHPAVPDRKALVYGDFLVSKVGNNFDKKQTCDVAFDPLFSTSRL
jgi:isopenicillin N synthase-like dioxygenase